MTRVLSNISLKDFRNFLAYIGCEKVSTKGGHEKWKRKGGYRSVIFQTHKDPIPLMVVLSNLRTLGLNREDFEIWFSVGKPKENNDKAPTR